MYKFNVRRGNLTLRLLLASCCLLCTGIVRGDTEPATGDAVPGLPAAPVASAEQTPELQPAPPVPPVNPAVTAPPATVPAPPVSREPAPPRQSSTSRQPGQSTPPAATSTYLPPRRTSEVQRLRFNFRHQPYKDVVEWFAEQAGLSLEIASFPAGTFNYSDPNEYSPEEALDIINSVLLFKEYTLIRKGRMLFVLNLQDGIPPNLLEPIAPEDLTGRGKYELVRCVWSLIRTTPDVIQAEVERMLGPQGSIVVLPKSQQIVIIETAGVLRAINDVIKRIDDPIGTTIGNIHTVTVKNVTADEALLSMRRLLGVEENDPSLRAIVDATGLKVWLSGRPDMVERAKNFLTMIDESYDKEKPEGQPQVEVFDTGTADPTTVMAVLQTLLTGIPDVRLSLDPKTSAIIARGRLPEMATIKATISQMQLNAESVVSIPLTKLSAQSAVDALRKIFPKATSSSGSGGSSASTTVLLPIIEADAAGRAVIVKATPTQMSQIREALLTLGETGIGTPATDTRTIRTIPLSPAAATYVVEQLQTIWPTLHDSELKVVAPSAMVPARIPTVATQQPIPSRVMTPVQPDVPRMLQDNGGRRLAPPSNEQINQIIDETFQTRPPITQRGAVQLYFVAYSADDDATLSPEVAERTRRERIRQLQAELTQLEAEEIAPQPPTTTPVSKPPAAPVVISSGPGGLMLTSTDSEALSKLESLVRLLSDPTVLDKSTLTIYYLKHSTAEIVAQTLQGIMGTSGLGQNVDGLRLEDDTLSQALGLIGAGDSYEATGTVKVMAEPRLNALMVQANAVDHRTIERLLPVLDQPEIPGGDPLNRPRPHLVTCTYIKAEEAMARVKEVFADRMQGSGGGTGNAATAQQRGGRGGGGNAAAPGGMPPGPGGGPQAFLQAMMSQMGGGGGGGSSNSRSQREAEAKMTLSIDQRSNSLIIYAPDVLALEVTTFVRDLDQIAGQTEIVVESYQLRGVNMATLRQALGNAAGDGVSFSSTSQSASSRGAVDLTTNFASGTAGRTGAGGRTGMTGGLFGGGNTPRIGGMTGGGGMFGGGNSPFGGGMGGGGMTGGGMGGGGRGGMTGTTGGAGGGQRSTFANPAGGGGGGAGGGRTGGGR